jgi:hypothetical protein
MRYSTDRSYRDCVMVEVEKMIKKIDESKTKESFIKKLINFIKKIIKKIWKKKK